MCNGISCLFSRVSFFETNQNNAMQQDGVSCAPAVVVCFSVSSGRVIWYRIEMASDAKFLTSFEQLIFVPWLTEKCDNTALLWLLGQKFFAWLPNNDRSNWKRGCPQTRVNVCCVSYPKWNFIRLIQFTFCNRDVTMLRHNRSPINEMLLQDLKLSMFRAVR